MNTFEILLILGTILSFVIGVTYATSKKLTEGSELEALDVVVAACTVGLALLMICAVVF